MSRLASEAGMPVSPNMSFFKIRKSQIYSMLMDASEVVLKLLFVNIKK